MCVVSLVEFRMRTACKKVHAGGNRVEMFRNYCITGFQRNERVRAENEFCLIQGGWGSWELCAVCASVIRGPLPILYLIPLRLVAFSTQGTTFHTWFAPHFSRSIDQKYSFNFHSCACLCLVFF